MKKGPLEGVRVLELAGLAPGPFCGLILSDFGAEVIRIDGPNPNPFIDQSLSRGKKSIIINLKSKEGTEVLLKLMETVWNLRTYYLRQMYF